MPLCPVCGGNIASNDQNCPYCGKTQLRLGDPPTNSSEWDLPMDDNTSVVAPWAPAAEQPPPPPATEDWILPEAMLDSPPPPPVAPAPPWANTAPSADVSLPPWAPVAPPAQVTREPTTFDFDFDLDNLSSSLTGTPQPAPVPGPAPAANVQPPVWQPPAASANFPSPPPISPVPVMLVPVTPVAPPPPVSVAPAPPAPVISPPPAPAFTPPVMPPPAPPLPSAPAVSVRVCPSCGKTFGSEYNDSFCLCGAELTEAPPPPTPAPVPPPKPPARRVAPQRPPAGTRCLVLYGADKQPVHYFALSKDAMLVGRLDAASGCFPDIDVSEYVDEPTARKVSRKHALILRSRSSDSFTLRPLPGNTGTQVEKRMLAGTEDVPLMPGTRLVLGGAVRLKFEVM
jgi:FHA domain